MFLFQAILFSYHARLSYKQDPYFRHNPKQQADRHVPPASHFHRDWEKNDLDGVNISGYKRYSLHALPNLFIINFTTLLHHIVVRGGAVG